MLATAALAISPGPDNIYVLTQGVTNGKKHGLATVAGLMAGCLIHTTLLAFGVSALIKESETLFFAIKLFGAAYLAFLAYRVFKSDTAISLSKKDVAKKSLAKLFKEGFIMNVLNPKVTIFFLAFFPGFLFSDSISTLLQFYVLGFLFIIVSTIVFGSIAVLSGAISNYLTKSSTIGIFLKWLQIVVFIAIAVYLMLSDN
jgi:threonine/homoserine/homoserine lactone efflux protein